jgi:hypothetical protein
LRISYFATLRLVSFSYGRWYIYDGAIAIEAAEPKMSLLIYERALQHSRNADAVKWNVRAAVTGAVRVVAPAIIKEGCEIAATLAGMLAIVLASLALDVWIWVPRLGR